MEKLNIRWLSGFESCPLSIDTAFQARPQILITAHSGAENTEPNTLESINKLMDIPCDALEVDVRRTSDGSLRLGHDSAQDGPTLEQCIQMLCHSSSHLLNCDLKESRLALDVLDIAKKYSMADRIVFTGEPLDFNELAAAAELHAQVWLNTRQIRRDGNASVDIKAARDLGLSWLNLCYLELVPELTLPALKESGLSLSAWTADTEEIISLLLSIGVQNITTRRPNLALRLRDGE
ncbi:MAG: glycerophosphodiester phosphodiesterase [Clostridia bacterium]|nr:glycerophosphodiester phosphodiesterase [Clostridia bacterium]